VFTSTNPVTVLVSNILGKLGAAGRTEAAAIARRDGHEVVFVVQGERVQQRPVQSQARGDQRLVSEGVQPGETVVVSPPAELRDGAAVHVENKQS
jgi:hypothetical protein